jgi:hypothetical protein
MRAHAIEYTKVYSRREVKVAVVDNGNIIIVIGTVIVLSQQTENAFALRAHTAGGGVDATDALLGAQAWMVSLYDKLTPKMSSAATFRDILVKNLTKGTDVGTIGWPTGYAGADGAGLLPTGVAGLITLPTTRTKTRGRKFIPALTTTSTSGGHWTGGALTAFANAAQVMLARVTSTPLSGMLCEYTVVSMGVGSFATYDPTGARISAIPAYQRRRKEGVGI